MTFVNDAGTSPGLDHFSVCCDGAFLSSHAQGGATVITATGEIDASNIHQLTDYAQHYLGGDRPVVVDLSELDFLGAQGIPALFEFGGGCVDAGLEWAVVPGHPVRRLLRICDKDGRIPTASSVGEALERFSRPSGPRRLLKVVTKTG